MAINPETLYGKLVEQHTISTLDESTGDVLLYVDRTVLNEYTSPQAFTGLRDAGRRPWRPQTALGVIDHVSPTDVERTSKVADTGAARQISYFTENCRDFGIKMFDISHRLQGIEHVVMPELGFVMPGLVLAAGDSHTTTYGAFGALGFGIGTSDIEHYLTTQTLVYRPLKTMHVRVGGSLPLGVTSKDLIMGFIRQVGADGAVGYAIEFSGAAISTLSIEGRMTLCNMAVECGARGALIAPDEKVYDYLKHRTLAPKGHNWEHAVAHWETLRSEPDALFEREVEVNAADIEPMVTWGTSPDQAVTIAERVPHLASEMNCSRQGDMRRAMTYMGLTEGTPLEGITIDRAFIGSCTNGRIEDLRDAAKVVRGRKVAPNVRAMIVPGSSTVRRQAELEGLDRVFVDAGFEWRQSGCSMCVAMNTDVLQAGERCASSTNRNFEGRQGSAGRTHLMSPAMVAASAIAGHLTDVRKIQGS